MYIMFAVEKSRWRTELEIHIWLIWIQNKWTAFVKMETCDLLSIIVYEIIEKRRIMEKRWTDLVNDFLAWKTMIDISNNFFCIDSELVMKTKIQMSSQNVWALKDYIYIICCYNCVHDIYFKWSICLLFCLWIFLIFCEIHSSTL